MRADDGLVCSRQHVIRLPAVATAILALGVSGNALGEIAPTSDIVTDVMTYLGFGPENRVSLEAGEILFSGKPDLEPLPQSVAVAGAMMLIGRPPAEFVEAYLSDATLRAHSDVLGVGSVPESGGDASALSTLGYSAAEKSETRRLRRAKAGDDYNLSLDEYELLATAKDDDAMLLQTYREVLWQRVDNYRRSGLDGMTPYARKKGQSARPAEEMQAALESAELLQTHFPDMHAALLDYPGSIEPVESRLYWIKTTVTKRPTISLVHRLLLVDGDVTVVAEREFYVAHTYSSMLTIAAIVPHEVGSLVFATNRTFTEKVRGGSFRKTMGRKAVANGFSRRFEELRSMLGPEPGANPN